MDTNVVNFRPKKPEASAKIDLWDAHWNRLSQQARVRRIRKAQELIFMISMEVNDVLKELLPDSSDDVQRALRERLLSLKLAEDMAKRM